MRELRNAFGCFATGITVVTTIDSAGKAIGKTANSFASVSLDPPLLLWCLNRNSVTYEAFSSNPFFVVSVLGANARAAATRFASRGGHFVEEGITTVPTELGPPSFPDALAVFECERYARHDGGDHVILVGRVLRVSHVAHPESKGPRPLMFFRGRFGEPADFGN